MGSAAHDRLTEPLSLQAAEIIGKPLLVSEYERSLYEAEGKPLPEERSERD